MSYFAAAFMKGTKKIYGPGHLVSSVCMILALLWLTVSAPFVVASQQELSKNERTAFPLASNEEEAANPFGNTTEEKSPSGSSLSEEYMHDHHAIEHFSFVDSQFHKCENTGTYIAFHGDIHVPPPNVA
jgi:hypothetical protein